MSGLPLLTSQQSDFSFDVNQNQRSDTSHSSSQSSSTNLPAQNSQTPLLEENSASSSQSSMGNLSNHRTSSAKISIPNYVSEIKIHGYEPYKPSQLDLKLSVQDLIVKILNHENYSLKSIGPAGLQLFGIASIDPKRPCKCIWKNPQTSLLGTESSSGPNSTSSLCLRIRFIPSKDRVEKLRNLGKEMIHYLYYQCKEDFVDDRLKYLYGKEISSAKARGLAVLDMAITCKLKNRSVDDILNRQFDLKHFLPARERVTFWKKYKLKGNMKPHVVKLQGQQLDAEDMMIGYIRDILQEVIEYTIEQYDVKFKSMASTEAQKVTVLTDIHHEPSGIHIGKDHFSLVEDIRSMNIKPNYGDRDSSWIVHMDRSSGHPEEITFCSEEEAVSFVSGIDGYYRLIHDYYFSLCHQVEPPSVRELKLLKCFGPIEYEIARQKLRRQDTEQEDFYLLIQSNSCFDEFSLHYTFNGQTRRKTLTHLTGNRFCFKGKSDQIFENFTDLLKVLASENQLIPSRIPRRIGRPNIAEACGILKRLFVEEVEAILDEDAERESSGQRQKKQPKIFLSSEICINELLNVGHFTEVHSAVLDNETTVAVKVLRQTKTEQLFRCYEPLQQSINKQISFSDPHFLHIHGVCLSMPLRVVMDYAQYGSLATFFVRRRPDQPLYLHHLMHAATQVAEGLLYLAELIGDEICHGNICCQNIMVHRYEFNSMVVKIGDPGMISLYNKLPLTDKINSSRLPWISPERFSNLSAMNIKSDVYAFGTTMWEMFAQGCNPLESQPLSGLTTEQVLQFYLSGKKIGKPQGLQEKTEDSEEIRKCKQHLCKVMTSCWTTQKDTLDVTDRKEAKEIVRDLHWISSTYGESYHVYSEIPEETISAMNNNSAGSVTGIPDSNGVRDILADLIEFETSASSTFSASVHTAQSINPPMPAGQVFPRGLTTPTVLNNPNRENKNIPNGQINAGCTISQPAAMSVNLKLMTGIHPKVKTPLPETPVTITNIKYLIGRNHLRIDAGCIGKGHYGEVSKGLLHDFKLKKDIQIAAKRLGSDAESVLDHKDFKHEAEIMCTLTHPNVVRFIGICDNMVIMEYVEKGSMSLFLRDRRRKSKSWLPMSQIVQIIYGVAKGMEYIYKSSNKRIIHCDLAGRNILLDKDLVPKISDFGLAKALSQDKDYYTRSSHKDLPLKWCAPESIGHRRFTTKSDVWSYGIVVWEAVTHGKMPYSDWKPFDGNRFYKGDRLPQTENCPDDVYDLMQRCWRLEANQRPEFEEVVMICRDLEIQYPVSHVIVQKKNVLQIDHEQTTINNVFVGNGDCTVVDQPLSVNKTPVDSDQTHLKKPLLVDRDQTDLKKPVPIDSDQTDLKMPVPVDRDQTGLKKPVPVDSDQTDLKKPVQVDSDLTVVKKPSPVDKDQTDLKTPLAVDSYQIDLKRPLPVDSEQTFVKSQISDSKAVPSGGNLSPTTVCTTAPPGGSSQSLLHTTTPCVVTSLPSVTPSTHIQGRQLPPTPHEDYKFLIRPRDLHIDYNAVLGHGQYGAVYRGTYKGKNIAAKVLNKNIQDKVLIDKEFKDEIDVIGQLNHDKIVPLIGFTLDDYMIIMEYIERGSLLNYLQSHKKEKRMLSCHYILEICRDIAEGMEYISSKKVLHCDLAARNVLLTKDRKIKISDFGLSKILNDDKDYYRRSEDKAVPAFWSAPEVLAHKKMSTKGDIWSYGIVMWETFTHGENPNICKTVDELKQIGLHLLEKGVRLQKPDNCPIDVYELMKKCWDYQPLLRPPFSEIVKACKIFLGKLSRGESLD